MDNLPKDPPDENNPTPPPFGSNFHPHTNPQDLNNPYQPLPQPPPAPVPNLPNGNNSEEIKHEHYSEVAQNKPRDEHGHFKSVSSQAPLIHAKPDPQTPIESGQTPPAPNPSFLPPIIEINQNTKPTEKEDPPLFGFFLTNPVTYLKKFLTKLLKRQMITLRIPVLALIVVMVGIGGFGVGFKSGLNYTVGKLFPNFSPILHRSITAQGIIQKSSKGYYLQANDKDKTL